MKNSLEKKRAAATKRTNARRSGLKDLKVPMWGRGKADRVALGLALLQIRAEPGARMTRDDIAAWCGCTPTTIYLIEKKAIEKLRARLEKALGPEFYETLCHVLDTTERTPARRHRFIE